MEVKIHSWWFVQYHLAASVFFPQIKVSCFVHIENICPLKCLWPCVHTKALGHIDHCWVHGTYFGCLVKEKHLKMWEKVKVSQLCPTLPPHGLYPSQNIEVGSLTQESNWGLLHCRWFLHQLSYQGSPEDVRQEFKLQIMQIITFQERTPFKI